MKLGWDKSLAIDGYTLKQIIKEIETKTKKIGHICPNRRRQCKHRKRSLTFKYNESAVMACIDRHHRKSVNCICRESEERKWLRHLPVPWNRRADICNF